MNLINARETIGSVILLSSDNHIFLYDVLVTNSQLKHWLSASGLRFEIWYLNCLQNNYSYPRTSKYTQQMWKKSAGNEKSVPPYVLYLICSVGLLELNLPSFTSDNNFLKNIFFIILSFRKITCEKKELQIESAEQVNSYQKSYQLFSWKMALLLNH